MLQQRRQNRTVWRLGKKTLAYGVQQSIIGKDKNLVALPACADSMWVHSVRNTPKAYGVEACECVTDIDPRSRRLTFGAYLAPFFPTQNGTGPTKFLMDLPELERTIKTEVQVSADAYYPEQDFYKATACLCTYKTRIVHARRSVVCQKCVRLVATEGRMCHHRVRKWSAWDIFF